MKVCMNCFGIAPCLCEKPKYINMWDFIYYALITCKGWKLK